MWERVKIGDTLVEFDAAATREAYANYEGGINSCNCDYCVNYRLVRDDVYPPDFRDLLTRLGIDYCKEIELTHLSDNDSKNGLPYGQSVYGHYAFVGRVLKTEENAVRHDVSRFGYDVSSGDQVHPVTRGSFGNSSRFIDLNFLVRYVPKAGEEG